MEKTPYRLAIAGIIGALYAGLTYLFAFSGFEASQLRIAEALTLLPMLLPKSYYGLAVGCFLANLISGFGMADFIVGPIATLIAGYLTSKCKNYFWGAFWPVIINALAVGSMITLLSGGRTWTLLVINIVRIGLGQAIVCYGLGIPMIYFIKKTKLFKNQE